MNEDLKPCLDIESRWEMVPEVVQPNQQVFMHKDYTDLFRIVDFKKQTIEFRDVTRVLPQNVIDIYRDIDLFHKGQIMGLILRVIHEEKPIKMPYVHEDLKVYIEYHSNTLGILYYKDSDEEKSIVSIRRFFKMNRDPRLTFEEISWSEFAMVSTDFEKEEKHVDQA